MLRPCAIALLASLAASGADPALRDVLRSSADRQTLEQAACTLARSRDRQDLMLLGQLLRDHSFLARLDDLSNLKTAHLSRVMAALGEHPGPDVADLCVTLAGDAVFTAEGDRKSFLLDILAAVKPMSEQAAAVFRDSNEEGYFASNARLLAANGSPRALALFTSMMLDKAVPAESRVQCLHVGIVPHRMEPPMLQAVEGMLSHARERAIVNAAIESVFDYRQQWFGLESRIMQPPDWEHATAESRRLALHLADMALARSDLSAALRQTVSATRVRLR
jgi:hypothetical protein